WVPALRKIKADDISVKQPHRGMFGKVRRLLPKSGRIAGQHYRADAQVELILGEQQGFQHPRPNESRAAGEEDGLSTQVLPQTLGVAKDMFQVLRRKTWHALGIDAEINLDLSRDVLQHLFVKTGIDADPKRIVHDPVRVPEFTRYPIVPAHHRWLAREIA